MIWLCISSRRENPINTNPYSLQNRIIQLTLSGKLILFACFSLLWSLGVLYYHSRKKKEENESLFPKDNRSPSGKQEEMEEEHDALMEGLSFKLIYPDEQLKEKDYQKLSEMVININSIIKGDYKVPESFIKEQSKKYPEAKEKSTRKLKVKKKLKAPVVAGKTIVIEKKSGYIENVDTFFQDGNLNNKEN